MAETKFTHISVTPEEEEDIVIQAGAVPKEEVESETLEAAADEPSSSDVGETDDEAFRAGVESETAEVEAIKPKAAKNQEAAKNQKAAKSKKAAKAAKKDDYKPTTLEDIESSKMPTMQKVIIVIAVIAVIVFFLYYFLIL